MEASSVAASRRAAQQHARAVAAGPPRSARWTVPGAGVSALGAAVALPLSRPAALALVALAALLLAVHRSDRRSAWRYVPEPVAPARFLPPLRTVEEPAVLDLTAPAEPAKAPTPGVAAVHVPTQAVPVPGLPKPRVAVEDASGGRLRATVRARPAPAPRRLA